MGRKICKKCKGLGFIENMKVKTEKFSIKEPCQNCNATGRVSSGKPKGRR